MDEELYELLSIREKTAERRLAGARFYTRPPDDLLCVFGCLVDVTISQSSNDKFKIVRLPPVPGWVARYICPEDCRSNLRFVMRNSESILLYTEAHY